MMGKRIAGRVLVIKTDGRRQLGRPKKIYGNDFKMYL
jgi:hypothetical protein